MPIPPARQDALTEAVVTLINALVRAFVDAGVGPIAEAVAARVAVQLRGISAVGKNAKTASPFLNQRDAAVYTGRSVSSLRRARQLGLSFAVVGGLVVFERAVLDAWMRGENPAGAERARLDGAATPDGQPPGRGPPVTGERQMDR